MKDEAVIEGYAMNLMIVQFFFLLISIFLLFQREKNQGEQIFNQ